MKFLFIILTLTSTIGYSQNFSGEITYKTTIIVKNDNEATQKKANEENGKTSTYIIDGNQYKSSYFKDGKYTYSYTYDNSNYRMYDDYADKPFMTYRDARNYDGEYGGSEIYKDSTENILGLDCFLVKFPKEDSDYKVFYSEAIKVDFKNFEGHKVGFWYNKLEDVNGAINIKSISQYEDYIEITEAIKIEERKISPKEFKIPNKPLAASYTVLDEPYRLQQPSEKSIKCYQEKVLKVSKRGGEKFVSYVEIFLEEDGNIKYIRPLQEDEHGFYKIAMEIVEQCGIEFIPGKIDGKSAASQAFFPVEFYK